MSWDKIKRDQTFTLPEPDQKPSSPSPHPGPIRRPDNGRKARKTGRTKQFNPRVTPQFMENFAEARAQEAARRGVEISQAYFLELLLATYQRASGQSEIKPFGLSVPAFDAAQTIANRFGWSLSDVVEDAIAARYREFRIEEPDGEP